MDKLRAGAVAAFEGGLLYYCSAECKSAGPSARPGRPAPAKRAEPEPRTQIEPPRAPRSPARTEAAPEPESAAAEPRAVVDAPAAPPAADDARPEPEAPDPGADRGPPPPPAPELRGDDEDRADWDREVDDDEPEDDRDEEREPRPGAPARSGRLLPRPLRKGLQVLGSLALLVLAAAPTAFFAGELAAQVRLGAAVAATLWLAVEAAFAATRKGWRAGVEELVVLAAAALTVIAGLDQQRCGEAATALAAAPAIAAATWLARWMEALLRTDLVERLCRKIDGRAEAEALARLLPSLWGDSPSAPSADRGWVAPAGGRASAPSCPGMVEVFARVAAIRGAGASAVGRSASRAGVYVAVAIPVVAAALLVFLSLSEQPATAPALLLAAGTVLAMSPRALRRSWVGPLLRAAGRGAERGILFRDGAALEATARAHWVVFDSRGTLTWGEPRLTSVVPVGSLDADEILSLAAGAEKAAGENLLGAAIVRAAEERGLEPVAVRLARHNPGLGISATSPRGDLLVGTRQLVLGQGISVAEADETASEMEERAETVVFLAVGGRIQGVIGLMDELRPGAEAVARRLAALGVEPVLMTGDSRPKADALGRELGFEHVRAEVSPEQWAAQVASLRETEHGIAMVAKPPRHEDTLAAADVGLTLGCDDLEMETAGVALASEDPTAAVEAVALARRGLRGARLNLFVAATQMLVGLGLAWLALGLLQQWVVPALVALLSAAACALVVSDALSSRRP